MTDKKISELTGATTPLAGTEVLPIVQGGNTKKVAVSDLTAGRATSALTFSATDFMKLTKTGSDSVGSGPYYFLDNGAAGASNRAWALQLGGSSTYDWWVYTNTEGWVRRFQMDTSGNATLATGNVIIGTAGKGIDFSANTHAAGMTSELLNDYEEGTWTPVVDVNSGTATGYTIANSVYTKVGRVVTVKTNITPTGGTFGNGTGFCAVSGLPFAPSASFAGQMLNTSNFTKGEFALAGAASSSIIYIMEGITIALGNVATLQVTYFV